MQAIGCVGILDQRTLKLLIQRMNRALRDSHGGGITERFEAVSKLLFTKIVDEQEATGRWNGFTKLRRELEWYPQDSDRTVYERARSVWHRVVSEYPDVFEGARADFPDDVPAVARILRMLESIDLDLTPVDVKGGAYEEMLRNTFEKNDNQQYFTPRHVVDFVVELCGPRRDDMVCDPAAGSGGFLVGALIHVLRDGGDVTEFANSMRGAEVDERMAWIARINTLMHGGDPRSIHHFRGAGSLQPLDGLANALPAGSFDLILTNPPFGSDLTDPDALSHFVTGRSRASRRRGILFLERCIELLRPGGHVAIVLDDSVLNLPSNVDIREIVRAQTVVEAVVSLPDVTFMPYSTAKSSILVLRRRMPGEDGQPPVFMADVESVGNRPNGDPLYSDECDETGQRFLKSDLPGVLAELARFRAGQSTVAQTNETVVFSADLSDHDAASHGSRLDVFYFHPARKDAQELLATASYPLVQLSSVCATQSSVVSPADEYADAAVRWIGLGDIESLTGSFETRTTRGDRIRSSAHLFAAEDVLFSRLRPKLRKAVLIPKDDEGGICSSELIVLRPRHGIEQLILPEFLAFLLRSDLVYGQLIYQITGVGRPRVSTDAIRRLMLPLPPVEAQAELLVHLNSAANIAASKRRAALRDLDSAHMDTQRAYGPVLTSLVTASFR